MDWRDFFNMGGYAFYVWGSYLTALILIGGEVLAVNMRKKKLASRRVAEVRLSEEEDR